LRARALHSDVIVVTSALLQVNCVLVRGAFEPDGSRPQEANGPLDVVEVPAAGDAPARAVAETFVIDSPVLPEELELLPSVLEQARFPAPSGLLVTHADWDHVLGPLAFPDAPLGCAESSAERLAAAPGEAQRELRSFDEELYLQRPRPLVLDPVQALPVPGHCEIGSRQLELHPTEGHTVDGMAIWAPWAGVLIAGDYVSKIEIPMLNPNGDAAAYLQTLERLRPLVAIAGHVVPGHGPVLERVVADRVLDEDTAYLRALLERGADAELPPGRRSREMRSIHARNVARLSS
jgi:glyoxylase-like metal-dependent hydrolase (beta-lactamase superfamily II)